MTTLKIVASVIVVVFAVLFVGGAHERPDGLSPRAPVVVVVLLIAALCVVGIWRW
jgi:hypothetical protein